MHSFHYRDGRLFCEDADLISVAEKHGSPLYVYSKATICDHYDRLDAAMAPLDHEVCYAVKANSNLAVLDVLAKRGSGFDIVSAGELFRVIKAGGDPGKCTFAGVGKTRDEIVYALEQGVYSFNVESETELNFIDKVAGEIGRVAPIAVRLNPNVDAKTHEYISTGKKENKFGIDFDSILEVYDRASRFEHVNLRGVQMHIGSQLTSVGPFHEAVEKVAPLVSQLKEKHAIEFFSIGGGMGIVYEDSLASGDDAWWAQKAEEGTSPMTVARYADTLVPLLKPLGLRVLLEPGRYLVGNAGVLITKVLYEKRGAAKLFTVVDAGMNDLIRPALYQGHHDIVPLLKSADKPVEAMDIVGPICESGDFFAKDREMPAQKEGDYLALMSAGAYGFVMASNYNSRPFPAEVLVDEGDAHLIRARQNWDDLIAGELIP